MKAIRPRKGPCRRPLVRWPVLTALAGMSLLLCVTMSPLRAEDNADQNLYVDYLAGSWDDWSFNADRTWDDTEHVRSFDHAGKISFTQSYGALRMHFRGFETRAFNTAGFTELQLSIHWGDQAPQDMLIYALRNSENDQSAFNKTTKLSLAKYGLPDEEAPEDGWFRYQVPLVHLGVANVADLTDILLSGPKAKVPFWIDDVKLVKPRGPSRITLNVDAGKVLRTVDGRHLGVNTAAWDYTLAEPSTIARVQGIGAQFFRFPGGSSADRYHWETNTIDSSKTGSDTTQFMKVVKAAGGQAVVTVNYGTGTPDEAARWVKFANVDNDFKIQYWEIGNENYGDWEAGSHDPNVYAQKFGQYVTAMKAVDPTIKVGMVGTYSHTDYNGWSPKVLKALKVNPDFYVVHYYPQVRWSGTAHEDDADLLQYPRDWATIAQIVRTMLDESLGAEGASVEIVATENNSVSGDPGKQSTNFVNALFLADSLGQVLNTEITGFMWWDLHNSRLTGNNNSPVLYGFRDYGDYGLLSTTDNSTVPANTPYAPYYAMQLASGLARAGSRVVASTSNNELLPVYAALRPDGSLALLVLNKHSQRSLSATVNLSGFNPTQIGVQQFTTFQDTVQTGVARYDTKVSGPRFLFTFPSYSITLMTLTQ